MILDLVLDHEWTDLVLATADQAPEGGNDRGLHAEE